MSANFEPTEITSNEITVIVLPKNGSRERVPCSSFEGAIETVKEASGTGAVVKIEDRDGHIVFDSTAMDIDDWENEWKRAKRRLSVDVEDYDCPYDSVGCLADDLCVQCKIDKVQQQY